MFPLVRNYSDNQNNQTYFNFVEAFLHHSVSWGKSLRVSTFCHIMAFLQKPTYIPIFFITFLKVRYILLCKLFADHVFSHQMKPIRCE